MVPEDVESLGEGDPGVGVAYVSRPGRFQKVETEDMTSTLEPPFVSAFVTSVRPRVTRETSRVGN